MNSSEEKLRSAAIEYQTKPKQQWTSSDQAVAQQFRSWYAAIHSHFQKNLLPQIVNDKEHFIEYWPAYFIWGVRSETKISGDSDYIHSFEMKYGIFSTGYMCLSSQNVYLVGIANLSKQYTLLPIGFWGGLVRGGSDARTLLKEDKLRRIGYDSLDSAVITQEKLNGTMTDCIQIKTAAELIQIYTHFNDTLETMLMGIKMGQSSKLVGIDTLLSTEPKTGNQDIPELLRMLAALRDAGVVTKKEFDEKSKRLLSRL